MDDNAVARICQTIGISIATQVEGYNIHHRGKTSLLCVWLKAGLNLEPFCKDVSVRVGNGVVTGMIRPAGRNDVTVTVVGLDFNTPDAIVRDYLNKFGNVIGDTTIYSKFQSGPFVGKFNGERKYQADFTTSKYHMGSFHLIDGHKVRIL